MITFIKKSRQYAKWLLPVNIGFFGVFMLLIQAFYLYKCFAAGEIESIISIRIFFLLYLSFLTVLLFFQLVSAVFSCNRWLHLTGLLVGLTIYGLIIAYQFKTKEMLKWDVVAENISSAWSLEAADVIFSSLDSDVLKWLVILGIFFVILEWRRKLVTKGKQQRPILPKVFSGFVIYFVCLALATESYDPFIQFSRTIWFYYNSPINRSIRHIQPTGSLVRTDGDLHTGAVQDSSPEYVFLIMVESLNASAIGRNSETGIPFTPFLNQLRDNSIYVNPFYGNSIQTAKGHFATLFSVIPTISGKEFKKYSDLRLRSIGDELSEAGYASLFFGAHRIKNFDGEYEFLSKRGFPVYETADPYLNRTEKSGSFIWGPQDSDFYCAFFRFMDQYIKKQRTKRLFVVLSTVANHYPFDCVPKDLRRVYPEPQGVFEKNYANSVRLSDDGLRIFFEELRKRGLEKKSLVIITGDHAFPMGEHGSQNNEAEYHEESFRIPLFIKWEGVLKPQKITTAFSQMDIGPTIVDLTQSRIGRHNMQGQSIFSARSEHPIFLIQHYLKQLSVVRWPIKYRFHANTQQEFAYDLRKDPMEKRNIYNALSKEQKGQFQGDLKTIYLNEAAVQKNLFYPEKH